MHSAAQCDAATGATVLVEKPSPAPLRSNHTGSSGPNDGLLGKLKTCSQKSLERKRLVYAVQQQQSDSQKPPNECVDESGASEGLGKASPDVLRLFSETQRNLLELNRSRLSALDELRVAKNKISALGEGYRHLLDHCQKCMLATKWFWLCRGQT